MEQIKRIAILGGGPSGLFLFKRFVDENKDYISLTVFEKKQELGSGMPYSREGANDEHITNVSGNEIPELETSLLDWMGNVPKGTLEHFNINLEQFHEYKVLPRLLFGQYLSAQFSLLKEKAKAQGMDTSFYMGSEVVDIIDQPEQDLVVVETADGKQFEFDQVIVCTGHRWPLKYEGTIAGCYDAPYPPAKIAKHFNHTVAIKGSSLTAIDAVRTLARNNGVFSYDKAGNVTFQLGTDSPNFKMIMHSRNGMLPGIRFHLEDSHLLKDSVLSKEEVNKNREENGGFLSLDYIFQQNFKEAFKDKRPRFYALIKEMSIEDFVQRVMKMREQKDAFQLFGEEYCEAERSIDEEESVYWKEMLAVLSFAMNYPAKYFSAEDMQRLQKVLMPLISIVIAFVPQKSVEEMLALHEASLLEIVSVGEDGEVEPLAEGGIIYNYTDNDGVEQAVQFQTYIDCVGQPHLSFEDLPYKSLIENETVSPAKIKFFNNYNGKKALEEGNRKVVLDRTVNEEGDYYLRVPGITINDSFQVVDRYGASNPRVYIMAVPYIGGYNPDYSGLDFCEAASGSIIESILAKI